jgi:hypothetical protein
MCPYIDNAHYVSAAGGESGVAEKLEIKNKKKMRSVVATKYVLILTMLIILHHLFQAARNLELLKNWREKIRKKIDQMKCFNFQ